MGYCVSTHPMRTRLSRWIGAVSAGGSVDDRHRPFAQAEGARRLIRKCSSLTESAIAELLFRGYFGCGRRGHRWSNYVNSCVRSSCNCGPGIRYRHGCGSCFSLLTRSIFDHYAEVFHNPIHLLRLRELRSSPRRSRAALCGRTDRLLRLRRVSRGSRGPLCA
jgi:hypothetical protein